MQPDNGQQRIYLDPTALYDGVERLGIGNYEMLLERLESASYVFVSDVYALQQVIYKRHLHGDTEYGYRISERLQSLLIEVYPVTEGDLLFSKWLAEEYPNMLPRERLHVAIAWHHKVQTIVTGRPDRYRHLNEIKLVSIRKLLEG